MQEIGAFEAKTHFSSLLEQVEKGEQIIITKHGRPVAKLVPVSGKTANKEEVIARLKKFCEENGPLGMDWKELRDWGRK